MKATFTTLLGAAAVLLGSLTATYAGGKGNGGGKGGSGGGGSTPQGTVYYYGNIQGWTGNPTISMNPDGSNKTVVGSGSWAYIFGNPSRDLHNTHRFFLTFNYLPDPDHVPTEEEPFKYLESPDGSRRAELFALRDDYNHETNNGPGTWSQLTDDPTLQLYGPPRWLPGEDSISFVGRRWSSAAPGATVGEGGIYVVPLLFDADGNVIGLSELPTIPTIPFPLVPYDNPRPEVDDHPRPDVTWYSWNPDATEFVFTKLSDPYGVWVGDRNGWQTIISPDPGHRPQWSPDGSTIAYGAGGGLVTMKPNGKRRTWILRKTSTWTFSSAHWSLDSGSLIFTGQFFEDNGTNHDVFRMGANGADLVNLTNTAAPAREMTFGWNAGWR